MRRTCPHTLGSAVIGPLAALLLVGGAAAATGADDAFLRGYATAVLERELGLRGIALGVRDGVIRLRAEDLTGVDRARVEEAVASIPGVQRVEVVAPAGAGPASPGPPGATREAATATAPGPDAGGPPPARLRRSIDDLPEEQRWGFLPSGLLFDPLLADPRWPNFSAAYQRHLGDRDFRNVAAVSFGETFPLYRDRLPGDGRWELGLQASVFAIFDLDAESFDLINADYFVGIPLSVRWGPYSAMVRLFHQSSHLGDEFILRSQVNRVNLSYESVDVKVSRDFLDGALRVYAGAGVLFHREPSGLAPGSAQYGVEILSPWRPLGPKVVPVLAADFQHREENAWALDLSIRGGLRLDGVSIAGRSLLLFLGYFHGRSPNGQFYRQEIEYVGLGAHMYY